MNSLTSSLGQGPVPLLNPYTHFDPVISEPRKRPAFYKIGSKDDADYPSEWMNSITEDTDSSKDERVQLKLSSIVALMGLSGLAMPLFALLQLPFELMNPNVLLAKAFTLLAIPVGIFAYGSGRSFKYSPMIDVLLKFLLDPDEPPQFSEDSKAFFFLNRNNGNETNSSGFDDSVNNSTVITNQEGSIQKTEQCLQRIACEGFVRSLPQVFIKSLLRGQESMLRELGWNSSPEDQQKPPSPSDSQQTNMHLVTPIPMRTFGSLLLELLDVPTEGRKKDLAKLALKRIRNPSHHYLKQGSTSHKTKGPSKGSPTTSNSATSTSDSNTNGCLKYHCSLML